MALFNYGTWPSWILNPFGNLLHLIDKKTDDHSKDQPLITRGEIDRTVSKLWDDATGKSAVELENKLARERAEEEYQRNLQSIEDTADAYEAAGFNRNLMYGSSPTSYSAPELQAYTGSSKLDTILSRVGKVLNFIPAMYQATAALESIDQARERTKQQEIKTMTDGINMLRQGYEFGKTRYSLPFIPIMKRPGRNWMDESDFIDFATNEQTRKYHSAAMKNTMDLLASIGISNQLRSTRNSYLGYQYDLDRRFGAMGRMVGMASQGIGAAAKFLPLNSFFKR